MKNHRLLNAIVIGFAILLYGSLSFCVRSDCAYIKSKDILFVGMPNILKIEKHGVSPDDLVIQVEGKNIIRFLIALLKFMCRARADIKLKFLIVKQIQLYPIEILKRTICP